MFFVLIFMLMFMCRCRLMLLCLFFFFQAEDGIRDLVRSRGLGDVYKRQVSRMCMSSARPAGRCRFPLPFGPCWPACRPDTVFHSARIRSASTGSDNPYIGFVNDGHVARWLAHCASGVWHGQFRRMLGVKVDLAYFGLVSISASTRRCFA